MNRTTVTTELLDELVGGSHAEGTTCLAVGVTVEHHDRVLLIETPADDDTDTWELPTTLVLPGETLLDALHRTLTVTTGLNIDEVTGYTGHEDRLVDEEVVRIFIFTVTATDPNGICCPGRLGYRWTYDHLGAPPIGAHRRANIANRDPDSPGPATVESLGAALRAHARGLYSAEAAVDLLVAHQSWLRRRDFVSGYVDDLADSNTAQDQDPPANSTIMACVAWETALRALDAGHLPCSSSEAQLLRIAASLATGYPVDLRDALTSLDASTTQIVAHAVIHAAGH